MPFKFANKFVIPAPFVTMSKGFHTTEDGQIIGTNFLINIKGKLSADKGSPTSSGTFWTATGYPPDENVPENAHLANIFRKQEALRLLFSNQNEGGRLEFTPWDGTGSVWCNPRIAKPVEFLEGNWFNTCEYSIQLECDRLYTNSTSGIEDTGDPLNYLVSKANEDWNIEAGDERARTYRLTRNVSAVGKRFYNTSAALHQEAWKNAKDYVLNKIGLGIKTDRMTATGVLNAGNLQAYNYMRAQKVGELEGTFQVTETWLCFDPGVSGIPAMEDFTVNVRTADNGLSHVSCEGTITGFEVRNNTSFALTSTRGANAVAKYNAVSPDFLDRCENISGLTLNPLPLAQNYSVNENNGIVSYSQEYDDRVTPTTSGAISETITVQIHNAGDVFAAIPVLGRAAGPVLQSIGTVTVKKKDVSMEIVMPASRQGVSTSMPDTNSLLTSLMPGGTVFLESDVISWTSRTGRYSRNASFTWQ